MTIAVFGGTGRTGRLFVQKALAAGHKVRILARDPDKLAPVWGQEMIAGDLLDGGKVMLTLTGCDAVAIFAGMVKGSPDDFSERTTNFILQGMKKLDIKPLVCVTSLGVGDSKDEVPLIFKIIMNLLLKKLMLDKDKQEQLIRASETAWTILRPTGLTEKPEAGTWKEGTGSMKASLTKADKITGMISRGDVATLALKALGSPDYKNKTVWISN